MIELTDIEIEELINEEKIWQGNQRIRLTRENGHERFNKELETETKNRFRVFIRQNIRDPLNFSIGLIYIDRATGENISLLRCNGPTHQHPNKIEGDNTDFVCHIHRATQRYIEAGKKPEGWANETGEFNNIDSALAFFSKEVNIRPVPYLREAPPVLPELF